MKILELLEPKIQSEPIKTKTRVMDMAKRKGVNPFMVSTDAYDDPEQLKNKLVKTLGSALHGSAFEHEHRPGEVTKTSKPAGSLEGDGYYSYVTAILKNQRMQSNPYFPKIYGMKVYETPDGYFFYVIKMEKLYPLKQLDEDEIAAIAEKTLHILPSKISGQSRDIHSTLGQIMTAIEYGVGFNHKATQKDSVSNIANIKDPQLKQAMLIIKKFTKSGQHENDLHSGNVMFRRTQHGAQLVITDPMQ